MDKLTLTLTRWLENEPVRVYVYGIMGPLLALLVTLGLVSGSTATSIGAVASALLLAPTVEALRKRTVPETRTPQLDAQGDVWYPVAKVPDAWSSAGVLTEDIAWPTKDAA